MKKIILRTLIICSLLIALPSIVRAVGPCTAVWSFHQENIDNFFGSAAVDCDGDPACLTEITFAHNIANATNNAGWALCCAGIGPGC